MILVVDTNIIISALIKNRHSRKIIYSDNLELYTPEYVLQEIYNIKDKMIKRTKKSEEEIDTILELFLQKIELIPDEKIEPYMNYSIEIMENIDIKDSPILACALAILNNGGIWTQDKHFYKQTEVKAWNTKELLFYLNGYQTKKSKTSCPLA